MKKRLAYQHTIVSANRSRDEIEKLLLAFGADGVAWQSVRTQTEAAMVLRFKLAARVYRFQVHLGDSPKEEWRLMRVLWHGIKALLTQAEAGVLCIEDLLMAYSELALPDGSTATVGEVIKAQLSRHEVPDLSAGLKMLPAPKREETR